MPHRPDAVQGIRMARLVAGSVCAAAFLVLPLACHCVPWRIGHLPRTCRMPVIMQLAWTSLLDRSDIHECVHRYGAESSRLHSRRTGLSAARNLAEGRWHSWDWRRAPWLSGQGYVLDDLSLCPPNDASPFQLLPCVNAMMALPFCLASVLLPAVRETLMSDYLTPARAALMMSRWVLAVDGLFCRVCVSPLGFAAGLAVPRCLWAILGVIALFADPDLQTLPLMLYTG